MNARPTFTASRYAKQSEHRGVTMELVGFFQDIAAYYRGTDGNYWAWHTSQRAWVNQGARLRNVRGVTLDGADIETLPDLSAGK